MAAQVEKDTVYNSFKQDWLDEITAGNPSSVQKGRSFARKILSQWLDFDQDNDEVIFCDGAGDGGIDAVYFQRSDSEEDNGPDGDTWYLIQSKYGKAFTGNDTLLIESQKVIDTVDGKRSNLSSLSSEIVKRVHQFRRSASEKDKLILVFATIEPLTDSELRALQDIKSMGVQRLGALFNVDCINLHTIFNRLEEQETKSTSIKVPINANLVQSGSELLVGSVKLINLYNFLKDYLTNTNDLDLIYVKNVRQFLGGGRQVNKGIAKTIDEQPERFGLYNNGITIVVEDFKIIESDKYELTEPYIVNGCQTTKTIWNELKKKIDSGGTGINKELDEYKERLNKGILVVKIVKVGSDGEELLINTTKFTNSQNSVGQKDFLALEKDFRNWSGVMASKYNVYLEIQRGGWEGEKSKNRTRMNGKEYAGWANAFDLLKIYGAAWLYEPGLAFGKNPPFAPGGSIFKKITETGNFGVDELYGAYLLLKLTKELNFGRGASFPTRGQTRYLFCFVFMQLLKDVMIYANLPTEPHDLSIALIKILENPETEAARNIYNSALQVIDEYMTKDMDNCIYSEPKYTGDSNAFLKDVKLGKSDDVSPKLINLISLQKQILRRPMGGNPIPMSKVIVESLVK
ncbi:MAG TPA: AIPR family protein [Bacteroidia bacterium]|nr:AIPR family protein [Bacteroidia bacterium]